MTASTGSGCSCLAETSHLSRYLPIYRQQQARRQPQCTDWCLYSCSPLDSIDYCVPRSRCAVIPWFLATFRSSLVLPLASTRWVPTPVNVVASTFLSVFLFYSLLWFLECHFAAAVLIFSFEGTPSPFYFLSSLLGIYRLLRWSASCKPRYHSLFGSGLAASLAVLLTPSQSLPLAASTHSQSLGKWVWGKIFCRKSCKLFPSCTPSKVLGLTSLSFAW